MDSRAQLTLSGSEALLTQFCEFLVGCFGRQFTTSAHKYTGENRCYRVQLSGNKAAEVISTLYTDSSMSLDRKYDLAKRAILYVDGRTR